MAADAASSADDASRPVEVGELIVTATRQNLALDKAPLSVAAYSRENLDARGVREFADIVRLTPGLAFTPLGSADVAGSSTTISIRGVVSSVGAPTTGIYVDDTPIQARGIGNVTSNVYPKIFDLDRVEVLRGPQGTLFGAGAEGGAIRFITPQPSLTDSSVYARSELAGSHGGAPSYEAGAAVGGPLVDDVLGFRVSGWYRRDGGYVDRISSQDGSLAEKNSNGQDSYVFRGALKWSPASSFSATLSVLYQNLQTDDVPVFFVNLSNPSHGKFNAGRAVPDTSKDGFVLPSLNLQYDGKGFSVISTTSYFDRSIDRTVDYTNYLSSLLLGGPFNYGPGEFSSAAIDDRQHTFSQEVRLQSTGSGRLNWVAGAFYEHSKQNTSQSDLDPYLNAARARRGLSTFALLNGNSAFGLGGQTLDEQKAVFAQVDYELLRNFKVTAGVRYADTSLVASRFTTGPLAGAGTQTGGSNGDKPVTPKFGVSYQANPDTLLYASAAKGYRIGGVNGTPNILCASALAGLGLSGSPATYQSDSLWSYEGGVKAKLFEGRLFVDASAFDVEWENIQRQISLSTCGSSFITNFGSARSSGFNLAATFKPAEGLTLSGAVGYADARLTKDARGQTSATGVTTFYGISGDKIGGPPFSAQLSVDYERPILGDRRGYGRIDYDRVGKGVPYDHAVFGVDPLALPSQAYNELDVRTGVRFHDIDASLFVKNLLDEAPRLTYSRYSTAYTGLFLESTLRPRTYGVTLSYRH